jgi:hypothetical protein
MGLPDELQKIFGEKIRELLFDVEVLGFRTP